MIEEVITTIVDMVTENQDLQEEEEMIVLLVVHLQEHLQFNYICFQNIVLKFHQTIFFVNFIS